MGGEPEKKANALSVGKFKRLDLAKKRDILEKVFKVSYLNNLTPEGPYGEACILLKKKQNKKTHVQIENVFKHFVRGILKLVRSQRKSIKKRQLMDRKT